MEKWLLACINQIIAIVILFLIQSSQPTAASHLSMHELQNWLTSCRKHLKTNMGSYLLRTGRDENLLIGDFYVLIGQLKGILRAAGEFISELLMYIFERRGK